MRVRRRWGNAGRRRPGVGLLLAGVILAGIGFAGTWSGTALASALVTGRQVKDGTLRSVDLKSDRAVTGADVRDGTLSAQKLSALPDGPAGPQGPQGLPGLDGLDNFDYEVPDPVSVSGFGEGEIFVPCRAGIVVGGGASSFSNTIRLEESRPLPDGTGWKVFVYNDSATPADVYGWAVCVSAP